MSAEAALGAVAKINLRCVRARRVVMVTDSKCQLPASSLGITAAEIARQVAAWTPISTVAQPSHTEPVSK